MTSSSPSRPISKLFSSLLIGLCLAVCGLGLSSPTLAQPQDRDSNGIIDVYDLLLYLTAFQPGIDGYSETFSYGLAWNSTPETTFDIADYFVTTAGSTWHYTGMAGATTEDDFRWTVETTQQNVGSGKMASRFRTDTDEASDDRNGDVDFWLLESDGRLEYWGLHLGKSHSIGEYATIPAQDIVFTDPVEIGHAGLKVGDTVTDTGAGSAQVIIIYPMSLAGVAKSNVKYTGFLSTFDTPLGTFTDVLRIVIDLTLEITPPGFSTPYSFEIKNNTFFLKKGVGMIAQDQSPDDNDAKIQGIDEGSVIVDGTPIPITAN